MCQIVIVGEQQEVFVVVVQVIGGIYVWWQFEFGQCCVWWLVVVGELVQDVEWFVEGDQYGGDDNGGWNIVLFFGVV